MLMHKKVSKNLKSKINDEVARKISIGGIYWPTVFGVEYSFLHHFKLESSSFIFIVKRG